MEQIDIAAIYTVLISLVIIIAITWINIVKLERVKTNFFRLFSKLNEILVMVSAIYFILFTYEAVNSYDKFLLKNGTYDKYAIAFCIYYGAIQIGILVTYKITRLMGRSVRMIKNKKH